MSSPVFNMIGGGGSAAAPILQDKAFTENGTYNAGTGYDGFGTVIVQVPSSGASAATIIVTAPVGSTVTAVKGSASISAVASGGTYTITIPVDSVDDFGVWTVTATKGLDSASTTVNVVETATYNITLVYPYAYLTVTAATGSTVTLAHGGNTVTGTENSGTWSFDIPLRVAADFGDYVVTATKGADIAVSTVSISATGNYSVTLAYVYASIVVTAPAGSTVTMAHDSTTVTGTEVVGAESSTWTFGHIWQFGTYTITATLGDWTSSRDVLVDTLAAYTLELSQTTYLYNEGDECTALTGGWISPSLKTANWSFDCALSGTYQVKQKNADNLYVHAWNGSSSPIPSCASFFTANPIDLTNYSHLLADVSDLINHGYFGATVQNIAGTSVAVEPRRTNVNAYAWHVPGDPSSMILDMDVSQLSGNYYVAVWATQYEGNGNSQVRCHKIWLE